MSFETFLNQAWGDHATNAKAVANRLSSRMPLIEKAEQIPPMANLAAHVLGEHLGEWQRGITFLQGMRKLNAYDAGGESEKAVARSIGVLRLAGGEEEALKEFDPSEQIRVLAQGAGALSQHGPIERARKYFRMALEKAQMGLAKEDPANRALAVTGNNLACALEEKAARSPQEDELMILAAETGRKYWEIAGTWREVSIAEYRLAMTFLKAKALPRALEHAQNCVEMTLENKGTPLEHFYGYEALGAVEKSRQNVIGFEAALQHARTYFEEMSEVDKGHCRISLDRLSETLEP